MEDATKTPRRTKLYNLFHSLISFVLEEVPTASTPPKMSRSPPRYSHIKSVS